MGRQGEVSSTKPDDDNPLLKLFKMIWLTLGIYASFIFWGYFQEKVGTVAYVNPETKRPESFQAPHILILSQCMFSLLFSCRSISPFLQLSHPVWKDSRNTAILIGFAMSVGAPLSYVAMSYIPYPFVVTVKMCKLLPIVLFGVLVFKEKYSFSKKLVCAIITVGVLGFSFYSPGKKDSTLHGPLQAAFGVSLVIMNLAIDGLHNSAQDSLKHKHKLGAGALQAVSNLSCFAWVAAILIFSECLPASVPGSGQISFAAYFFQAHPTALYDVLMLGGLNAVGQTFIFATIAAFDSITVTSINVTRKVFSVVISVFVNNHTLNVGKWSSLTVVLIGVILETRENIMKQKSAQLKKKD